MGEFWRLGDGFAFARRRYLPEERLGGLEEVITEQNRVRVVPHLHAPAAWNLALEHALYETAFEKLKRTGHFDPIVRTYSFANKSVVLGHRQPISEIDLGYCQDNGIDVTMRQTGGGSVFLNESDVQFAYMLPIPYTTEVLGMINSRVLEGVSDSGLSPRLRTINDQPVIRMPHRGREKSFVFDAQRRGSCRSVDGKGWSHILWHHGTILVSTDGYDHMPDALKATPEIVDIILNGNYWLSGEGRFSRSAFLEHLERRIPFDLDGAYVHGFTRAEISRARQLYKTFYADPKQFSDGRKAYGICYIPGGDYDMEKYAAGESVR